MPINGTGSYLQQYYVEVWSTSFFFDVNIINKKRYYSTTDIAEAV